MALAVYAVFTPPAGTLSDEAEVVEAGRYLETVGPIWERAELGTRREIAHALFDAVYIDVRASQIREYRPKAALVRLLTSLVVHHG